MATKKKLLQAAAGSAGAGGPLDVEDVFSTTIYTGTDAQRDVTNNLDLSGEGGMVWVKARTTAVEHVVYDTERGSTKMLQTNGTNTETTQTNGLSAFNSDGFTVETNGNINGGHDYCSWSFRKAPNFFDVVTYTGNGTAGRTVSHNLESVPGCMIIKCTSSAGDWVVYHRATDSTNPEYYNLRLNNSDPLSVNLNKFNNTAPTSTEFTVGTGSDVNASGHTYVAYLFAHHDGDGTFGADEDLDIIKCGSFYGGANNLIDLDWEAQWVLIKYISSSGQNWFIHDTARGWTVDPEGQFTLEPNVIDSEDLGKDTALDPNGFRTVNSSTGNTYVYVAIRKGTRLFEDATKVFDTLKWTGNGTYGREINYYSIEGLYDAAITKRRNSSGNSTIHYRKARHSTTDVLNSVNTDETATESDNSGFQWPDESNYLKIRPSGDTNYFNISSSTYVANIWKQARGFFDIVGYTGTGSNTTITHNLGVVPEMMWVKRRNNTEDWNVYHKDLLATQYLQLNQVGGASSSNGALRWNSTRPTSSVFSIGTHASINQSADTYIAFLFATLDGVSKVGSYTGDGTSGRVIDCGFTGGARYVLIKTLNANGSWIYWDTERGIVSGNDAALRLSFNGSELEYDDIDPDNSGFIINNQPSLGFNINESGTDFLFYAIA